jgi:hypothetical protein
MYEVIERLWSPISGSMYRRYVVPNARAAWHAVWRAAHSPERGKTKREGIGMVERTEHTHWVDWESEPLCFWGPVATGPAENLAAQGGITRVQCCPCGAAREVNINWWEKEYGPWGPSAAEQRRMADEGGWRWEGYDPWGPFTAEHRRMQREIAAEARARADRALLRRAGIQVVDQRSHDGDVRDDGDVRVHVRVGGVDQWVSTHALVAAADQPDTGDGLVQVYSALLRQAGLR